MIGIREYLTSRKFITLKRIGQYGFYAFRRNAWLSTAATVVMTVTLLVITTSFMMRMIFADTITVVEQRIDVSIYLADNVTEQQRQKLVGEIKKVPIVTDVEYISKDEAREDFAQANREELETLNALSEVQDNPFPASLRVSTSDPQQLNLITNIASRPEFAKLQSAPPSNAGERKQAIEQLADWSRTFELGGLIASIVFVVLSILIIFNTIRMAIFNRKGEIRMMRLIGADPSFIRGPFIVEAALYGIVASVLTFILIYLFLFTQGSLFESYEARQIQVLNAVELFKDLPYLVLPVMMLLGISIGVISSLLAMRRYLK